MSNSLATKPMSLRLPEDVENKIEKIAKANNLSKVDVIRLCLTHAVPLIEKNGLMIVPVQSSSKAA